MPFIIARFLRKKKNVIRMATEAFGIVIAGAETTSRTLTVAVYYLLTHFKTLERLEQELMTAMPDVRVMPSMRSLETLPWLTVVIKKSLRLSSAVTSKAPLVAPGELKFLDWIIFERHLLA